MFVFADYPGLRLKFVRFPRIDNHGDFVADGKFLDGMFVGNKNALFGYAKG